MKYCPRCNFSFADFHQVCDFDGAELISAPAPPLKPSQPSLLRRCLKSPALLAAVGLCAVVSSAFLIGYFEIVNQTNRIVKTEPSSSAIPATPLPAAPEAQTTATDKPDAVAQERTRKPTDSSSTRKSRPASTLARIRSQSRKNSKGSEVAKRTESPQTTSKKDPILTAMLKTTWRVLKKPFSF